MRTNSVSLAVVLALTLAVVVFSTVCLPSAGFMIDIATTRAYCGDGRIIVATAVGNHRAALNSDPGVDIGEFRSSLRKALSTRAEKPVYVRAEPGISFGEFVEFVAAVRPEAEIISLITRRVEALPSARYCLEPSCGACIDPRSARLRWNVN